eukprot:scaffold182385_cov35-Tisochrysis_lutea.AAC.5
MEDRMPQSYERLSLAGSPDRLAPSRTQSGARETGDRATSFRSTPTTPHHAPRPLALPPRHQLSADSPHSHSMTHRTLLATRD